MNAQTTFSINKIGKSGRVIANGNCGTIGSEQEALDHAIKLIPETKSVIHQWKHDYRKHGRPIAEMNVYGSNMAIYLMLSK